LGKIAVLLNDACAERERLGIAPGLAAHTLAAGDGWAVEDVVCTYRPRDASFEERHARYRVALVGAGTFNCRGPHGRDLLTPGSLLLGNVGEGFECGHEHGTGDRCLAFAYEQELFERLAFEAGVRGKPRLKSLRVPPVRALAPLVADACAAWLTTAMDGRSAENAGRNFRPTASAWDEVAVRLAAAAARFAGAPTRTPRSPRNADRGVARAVRLIERDVSQRLELDELSREASLSRFHFVRAFALATGSRLIATCCARVSDGRPFDWLRTMRALSTSRSLAVSATCPTSITRFARSSARRRARIGGRPSEERTSESTPISRPPFAVLRGGIAARFGVATCPNMRRCATHGLSSRLSLWFSAKPPSRIRAI
jgi:AraC-like DNA-binding protein